MAESGEPPRRTPTGAFHPTSVAASRHHNMSPPCAQPDPRMTALSRAMNPLTARSLD